jgi:hypothetical protein
VITIQIYRLRLIYLKDFAWGFVNIVAKALVKAGDKPDFVKIRRYINDIDHRHLLVITIQIYRLRLIYLAMVVMKQRV